MTAPPPVVPAAPLRGDLERLIVVCPSWIGDTVMATPVLRALREHLPRARVAAVMRPGFDDLLRGVPWIDEVVPTGMRGALGPFRVARVLRRLEPQAVLLLPNSFRSALAARFCGAPIRIGYDRERRGVLLSHALPVGQSAVPTPMVDYYARLAAFACGAESIETRLELRVTDAERSAASDLLDADDRPLVLLNPGANRPDKRWPADRFARLADALHESRDVRVAVSGGPGELDLLDEIVSAAGAPILNLARRGTDLGSLKAIIARAALVVTNDTGPRHIAAALGVPLVSLFGPTDHRWTTLGVPRERILVAEPFLPEEQIADRHPRLCAIDRITVEDVLAASSLLLDATLGERTETPRV